MSATGEAAAAVPEATANTRRVRTRQGCLTCRKRRRKCDEQKPRCLNCTGRGLSCRYGVQLSFLDANLFSLLPEEAQALREVSPRVYQDLKFVDGMDADQSDHDDAFRDMETSSHLRLQAVSPGLDNSASPNVEGFPIQSSTALPKTFREQPESTINNILPLSHTGVGSIDGDLSQEHQQNSMFKAQSRRQSSMSSINQTKQLDRSNGTEHEQVDLQQLSSAVSPPAVPHSQGRPRSAETFNHWQSPPRLSSPGGRPMLSMLGTSGRHPLNNSKMNEMLKFYVDDVAPWLEICSSPQYSMGTHLPILAMKYPPLLHSIVALASQQQSLPLPPGSIYVSQTTDLVSYANASIGSDIFSQREDAVTACAILKVCELLPSRTQVWRDLLKDRVDLFASFNIHGFSDAHRGSVAWVILRLDLAASIYSRCPVMTAVDNWEPSSATYEEIENKRSYLKSTSEWTRHATHLCARATQVRFCPRNLSQISDSPSAHEWKNLWSSTQSWAENIPPIMQPILTSLIASIPSAPPFTFPLLLHTSRPSLYAAIMHHTTCLLLLEAKPPALRQLPHLKTPTWHAVQICGLCVGNNAHWSWDPTILAALVYSGRFISYHEQREELLEFLRLVMEGTGWKIDQEVDEMVTGWRSDG